MKSIKVLLIALLFMSFVPSQEVAAAERKFNMSYLYNPINVADSVNRVEATDGALNLVAPNYFGLSENGGLVLSTRYDKEFVSKMHQRGLKVVPYISNNWDKEKGRAALARRNPLADEIVKLVKDKNFDGINVDFEGLNETDRDAFTDFIKILREKLPADKELSVAVAANPKGWTTGWHGMYDYANLAKYSDYLMVMSYDESYEGSAPKPVASISFVEKSIQYALNHSVPKEKIVMGVPFYGRLWRDEDVEGTSGSGEKILGKGVSLYKVNEIRGLFGGTLTYDSVKHSAKLTFEIKEDDPDYRLYSWSDVLPVGHYTLWFDNEQSIKEKLRLVQKYNLKGSGSWSLGQENREVWNYYRLWLDGKIFKDVSEDYWAKEAIWFVEQKGWIRGTSSTTFSPGRKLSRAQTAVILVRALNLGAIEPIKQSFRDVDSSYWAYREIEVAKQHGIFAGVNENTFAPSQEISRAQMAVVLHRILGDGESSVPEQSPFTDVEEAHWAYRSIAMMKERNIYGGYADGTFKAYYPTTRAQMAALMMKLAPYMSE